MRTVFRDLGRRLEARREVTATGCWEWTGERQNEGYGMTSVNGRMVLVHRLSYEREVGPIPGGLVLDHLCRNRSCFRPDHLEAVTQRENTMRSPITLASINAAKTHCPQGHPYDAENTMFWRHTKRSTMTRRCKACKREYDRLRNAARKAARS